MVRLDVDTAKAFIRAVLPLFDDLIGEIQKNDGWFRVANEIAQFAGKLNISNWPELFLDEARFRSMQLRLLAIAPTDMLSRLFSHPSDPTTPLGGIDLAAIAGLEGVDRARAVAGELNKVPSEQMTSFLKVFYGHLTEIAKEPLEEPSIEDIDAAKREFEALDEKTRSIQLQKLQIFGLAFVSSLFNYLSLATHGQKLTTLVQRAIAGDDKAFFLAVHVDKTILTHLPQFRDRYWRAVLEGDSDFLEYLSYRLRSPTIKGMNHYHTLWLLFVILDDLSILDKGLTNGEILKIYDSIPADHACKPINDEDYVRKQRAKYIRKKRQTE